MLQKLEMALYAGIWLSQGNLKQTIGSWDQSRNLPGSVDLRGVDLNVQFRERLTVQLIREQNCRLPAIDFRPCSDLGLLPVSAWSS